VIPEPLSKSRATLVRSLHRRKGRREHRAFLAEGERTLDELARSDASLRFGFARPEQLSLLGAMFPHLPLFGVDERLAALFATDHPQGLAVVVDIPEPPTLDALDRVDAPLLVLDGVADPGNVGTIIRSAEWFGVGGVILLEGCADPFNPKSVRASMGSIVRMPIVESAADAVSSLERPLYVLDAGGDLTLGRERLPRRGAYVIGSEAHGVSAAMALRGRGLAISGRGSVESLNAAIAASILCYELLRIEE
jgi:RNA methyltransferase, TrmH family